MNFIDKQKFLEHQEEHAELHAKLPKVTESQLRDGYRSDKEYYKQDEKVKGRREKHVNKERRRFLDMITKAGISTKLLKGSSILTGAMASRYALAQNASEKKIVVVYVSQGAPGDQWLPDGPGGTKDVSRPYGDRGVADLMAFRHVNVINDGHSMAYHALGDPQFGSGKPTFDMRIAEVMGAATPYSMMYLGANALMAIQIHGEPEFLHCISRSGLPVNGPNAALERFFNTAPTPREDTGPQQMIDLQRRALDSLRGKLGAEEYARIDQNIDGLESLASRIVPDSNADPLDARACRPNNFDQGNATLNQGYGQAELIASAFACGLTNVAILQVGDNKAYYDMPGYYGGEVHGGGSHGGDYGAFVSCGRGHHTVAAHMLNLLKERQGADGNPLIDNTLFVVTNCMGDGRDHSSFNSPWGIATRMPGFRTGFSTGNGGDCRDFFSAIPLGLGLPNGTYVNTPGDASRANILS